MMRALIASRSRATFPRASNDSQLRRVSSRIAGGTIVSGTTVVTRVGDLEIFAILRVA